MQNQETSPSHDAPPSPPPPTQVKAVSGNRSRRGCLATGLMVVGALAILLFLFFFGLFLAALIGGLGRGVSTLGARTPMQFEEDAVVTVPGVKHKTVVIEVGGLIAFGSRQFGGNANMLTAQIRQALRDPNVVATVLDVNSPGGEITAVDEVHHLVRELSRQGKPVVAVMRSMGASGAYYIAAAADHIVVNPLTITGSIGVIIPHFEYAELLEKVGVAYTPYKSGELKDLLSGGLQRDPQTQRQADEHLRGIVDTSFRRFAEVVAWGRSRYASAEEVVNSEFGDGRILSGTQAYDLGLVDQLGYFDNALDKARELAGLEKVNVVRYRRPWSLRDLWIMRAGGGDTNLMKIELPDLLDSGQALYYLLPGLL